MSNLCATDSQVQHEQTCMIILIVSGNTLYIRKRGIHQEHKKQEAWIITKRNRLNRSTKKSFLAPSKTNSDIDLLSMMTALKPIKMMIAQAQLCCRKSYSYAMGYGYLS